jgi:hypothetical protein
MENWETPSLPTKIFAPLFSPLLLPLFLHTPIKLARISTSGIRARLPVPLSESLPLLVSPLSPSLPLRRRSAAAVPAGATALSLISRFWIAIVAESHLSLPFRSRCDLLNRARIWVPGVSSVVRCRGDRRNQAIRGKSVPVAIPL